MIFPIFSHHEHAANSDVSGYKDHKRDRSVQGSTRYHASRSKIFEDALLATQR